MSDSKPEFPPSTPMIGPLFIANSFNWLGLGCLVVQCYYYLANYPRDRTAIKILVLVLFVFELVQTATTTHQAWWYMVTNWNNPPALFTFPWSAMTVPTMAGLIAALVQYFYVWRIWTLSRLIILRLLAGIIVLLATAQCVTAIVTSIIFQINATPLKLQSLHPEFSFWISASFVADVLVAGCMLYILYTAKNNTPWAESESLLTRLIVNTIGTGFAIALCGTLTLALFVTTVGASFQYLPGAYLWGKLYSNSMMVSLNSRKAHLSKNMSSSQGTDSIPMRLQVSREVRQEGETGFKADHHDKDVPFTLHSFIPMSGSAGSVKNA